MSVRTGLLAAVCLATWSVVGCRSSGPAFDVVEAPDATPADHAYVIPAGAGAALDRGEALDILPGSLDVSVGDVIEIVNDDDRGHLVGPFFVGAHETVRQEFSSLGTFVGTCSVHPSGELVLTVGP